MENNIRQIRQVFKNLKMQTCRNSDSRDMSRKSSRGQSRRGSGDILEEEIALINTNAMFPEEEEEEEDRGFMRSKSGSLFGSRDELHSLSRTRSGEDLRSDEDEAGVRSSE